MERVIYVIKKDCETERIIEHCLVQKDNSMYFNVMKYVVSQKRSETFIK